MRDDVPALIFPVDGLTDLTLIEMMTPEPADDPDTFIGRGHLYGSMGIYGGHFLGQALAAGLATVAEPKVAHSFHTYFLQRGDPDESIEYRVRTLRNGRGTDTRAIAGWQGGREVVHMLASFKLAEDGHQHQPTAPEVAHADELVAAREARGEEPFPFPPTQNGWTQMEWASRSFREPWGDEDPALRVWMRVPGAEGLTARQRQVVMAFLSDGPLMFNSILPYGQAMETH
ncbi:MAG: acyl-CoA thioesterase domain-containing protein, partial [Actinomycetota bacterium]